MLLKLNICLVLITLNTCSILSVVFSNVNVFEYNFNILKAEHPSPGTPYKGISRSGHLPDCTEGRLVAKLLNVAFTRRLVFTIGRSRTTGDDGVLTWNDIHHKTRTHGGTARLVCG